MAENNSGKSSGRPSGRPSGNSSGRPSGSSSGRPSGKPGGYGKSGSSSEKPGGYNKSGSSSRPSGKPGSSDRSSTDRSSGKPGGYAKPSSSGRSDDRGKRSISGPPRPPRDDRDDRPRVPQGPPVPEDVTGKELDRAVRAELSGLAPGTAEEVGKHLVMVARNLDDNPELAYEHAKRVKAMSQRLAVAREAMGLAAYHVGKWSEARSELRAFQRMSGSAEHLAMIADCERGLGNPQKALEIAGSPEASRLEPADRAELRIVAAGARADLGQPDAAVVTLQCPELNSRSKDPWVARLRYAYADALLSVGRVDEARTWFGKAAAIDQEGWTDAQDRLVELEGFSVAAIDEGDD